MTNNESKKHGLFDKNRKDKKENIGYQAIGDSRSSLDVSNIIMSDADHKIDDGIHINATVNLKKSKTFKIIVNKKAKEKEKNSKTENFKKPKNKKRKRKEMKSESIIEESLKEKDSMRPIFGVSLKEACKNSKSHDGYLLPAFFRQCINYLESENRLSFEGIYRIPGVNSQIVKLKQSLLSDVDIEGLLCHFDTAVITSIVKSFLRDIKPELIEKPLEALIFKTVDQYKDNMSEKVAAIQSIIVANLPLENRLLLALIISHMGKIIDLSSQNKMSLENLLIVLSPALHLHFGLLKLFYDHASELFGDLQVPVYVPPLRPSPQHEEELPETVEGINEELKKQISYLDDLHLQINEGFQNEKTEYLIWDVQLIVTKLKRKKYIAELNDPDLIKIELKKYERQLEKIHKDMIDSASTTVPPITRGEGGSVSAIPVTTSIDQSNIGAPPSSMDQELWQIQRTITTLNRKLRGLTTSTLSRPHAGSITPVIPNQKGDNINDDDDDESVQLNLTLRKLPLDSSETMDDEANSESDKDQSKTEDNTPCSNENSDVIVDKCEKIIFSEVIPDEMVKSSEEKTSDWLMSDQDHQEVVSEKGFEYSATNDNHLSVFVAENEQSVSSNGMNHTTEDYIESNSESGLTGSQVATRIDDLIQTGEMWTNEKEQLLSEDDDCRQEALRYLYMREELISIKNDLKTRLSSEANEITRLKRNIEDLEEVKLQKNFSAQNQYRKLTEWSSSPDRDECGDAGLDDDDDNEADSDDEEDEPEDLSSESGGSMQYSEQQIVSTKSSEDGPEDIADLLRQQHEMILDNERLEKDNMDLLEQIQLERNHCVELKVALRTHMLLTCPSPWPSNLDE